MIQQSRVLYTVFLFTRNKLKYLLQSRLDVRARKRKLKQQNYNVIFNF